MRPVVWLESKIECAQVSKSVHKNPKQKCWPPVQHEGSADKAFKAKVLADLKKSLANQEQIIEKVDQVLANQTKLAKLITTMHDVHYPTLALLLPWSHDSDTQEEGQSFLAKTLKLCDAVVDQLESLAYDKAELVFLCEGPMVLKKNLPE